MVTNLLLWEKELSVLLENDNCIAAELEGSSVFEQNLIDKDNRLKLLVLKGKT